jgi:hypothetical protein
MFALILLSGLLEVMPKYITEGEDLFDVLADFASDDLFKELHAVLGGSVA